MINLSDFILDKRFRVVNELNIDSTSIYKNLLEIQQYDGIQYFINQDHPSNSIGVFNRNDTDLLEIPDNGVSVFFNCVNYKDESKWQKVYVNYIPLYLMIYASVRLVYDDSSVCVKAYTLNLENKALLKKKNREKIIEKNIIYWNGTYWGV